MMDRIQEFYEVTLKPLEIAVGVQPFDWQLYVGFDPDEQAAGLRAGPLSLAVAW